MVDIPATHPLSLQESPYKSAQWNESQSKALMQIQEWAMFGEKRDLRIGGLAGTGKSFLAGYIPELLGRPVTYCAPTGRAASILTRKSGLPARTVHSLLRYGPSGGGHEDDCAGGTACMCAASSEYVKHQMTDGSMWTSQLVIVDEASMIPEKMWNELLALGARIIAVGDYGQLPPVGQSGFCVVDEDSLDVKLDTIVRQAEDSDIIQTAWEVRTSGKWPVGRTGDATVVARPRRGLRVAYKADRPVIVATNRERMRRNNEIRKRRGFPAGVPVVGDVVMCLKNDPMRGVFNGERGVVTKIGEGRDENLVFMIAEMEGGGNYVGDVVKAQFNSEKTLANEEGGLFAFGYAASCHKFQGSEADEVLVIAEPIGWMPREDRKKWCYTAATRAKQKLTVVIPTDD